MRSVKGVALFLFGVIVGCSGSDDKGPSTITDAGSETADDVNDVGVVCNTIAGDPPTVAKQVIIGFGPDLSWQNPIPDGEYVLRAWKTFTGRGDAGASSDQGVASSRFVVSGSTVQYVQNDNGVIIRSNYIASTVTGQWAWTDTCASPSSPPVLWDVDDSTGQLQLVMDNSSNEEVRRYFERVSP